MDRCGRVIYKALKSNLLLLPLDPDRIFFPTKYPIIHKTPITSPWELKRARNNGEFKHQPHPS